MRRLPLRSPPRVWGKVPVCCPEHRKVRITPAYAGKSQCNFSTPRTAGDHPRVCGEKPNRIVWEHWKEGSPPRMRGKVCRSHAGAPASRITPAYAGKSPRTQNRKDTPRDHPRVCGEKHRMESTCPRRTGSPPRMRGKESESMRRGHAKGITPAYAGKRHLSISGCAASGDHPRVCGEKDVLPSRQGAGAGSPPRMRGKVLGTGKGCDGVGITPACAGKRMVFAGRKSRTWDHPRVCGEKCSSVRSASHRRGSPPRMRGKAVPPRSAAANGCRGPSVPEYDAPP